MEIRSYLLEGLTVEREFDWDELHLSPAAGGVEVSAAGAIDAKRLQRQVSVLKGYLALAGRESGVISTAELPAGAGENALAAVWYERALHGNHLRERLIAGYNAFGALPGGFPAIRENLERWLGKELGEKLLTYVTVARQDEDDQGNRSGPDQPLPVWTQDEVEQVLRAVATAAKEGFAGSGSTRH